MRRINHLTKPGILRAKNQIKPSSSAVRCRMIEWATLRGNTFRNKSAAALYFDPENRYVGERCSMVTFDAFSASDGISDIAVAPLPMTTTFLPV